MSVGTGHTDLEERSVAYHQAVAERLDEDVRTRARAALERWAAAGTIHESYADRWRRLLELPLDALAAAIVAEDEDARDLRQCTPFAGVLPHAERWAIVRAR